MLVLLDSDGQHDPDEIPVLIKPVIEDGYDLATGSRKLKESKRTGKRPFIRPLGQFVLKIGLGTITRKRHSDPECGFRALSRRAMEVMNFKGKVFSVGGGDDIFSGEIRIKDDRSANNRDLR